MNSYMKQLHLRDTFDPRHRHEQSAKGKSEVLESHIFLKLDRDCKIKGRAVISGNKQTDFISKEEESSATVQTEVVLISCVIDAKEHQDATTIDIPSVFIQTRVEKIKDMVTIIVRG